MRADDPRHGTRSGYDAGCREDCCRTALRRSHKNYHLRALKMGGSTTVPTARAVEVLTELAGRMSMTAIAKPLGTSHSYVSKILRGEVKRISPEREAAILRLAGYMPTDTSHVNPLGARRRLRALHALGYSWQSLANETGINLRTVKDTAYAVWPVIEARHDARIREVFDRLSMRLPSAEDRHGRGAITRARANAVRHNWPPPLAWDDIDDPNEQPTVGTEGEQTRAEAVAEFVELGFNITEACRRLGMTREALQKWCGNHGLHHLYRALASREFSAAENQWTQEAAS